MATPAKGASKAGGGAAAQTPNTGGGKGGAHVYKCATTGVMRVVPTLDLLRMTVVVQAVLPAALKPGETPNKEGARSLPYSIHLHRVSTLKPVKAPKEGARSLLYSIHPHSIHPRSIHHHRIHLQAR
eukprot:72333-Prorocentrum_minimum.AAC.1